MPDQAEGQVRADAWGALPLAVARGTSPSAEGMATQVQSSTGSGAGLVALTAQITRFVGAMSEEKAASSIKWDRKRPTIKAETAEGLMDELVELENVYSEMGCRTWKKKWSVFRPSLQGRAKAKVDLELEENQLSAEAVASMDEESLERLYKYLLGCLEEEAHLTAEKKAQLATQAMSRVWMQPNSGPTGAEKFVRA